MADAIGGTIRQRTVRALRDRILTGTLVPGTRLDLDTICAEFGVSRTPLREALVVLSFEGLVEIAPRSRVTVIGVSPDRTMDNFAILAALSGKAAEWAAGRITPDTLGQLSECAALLGSTDDADELIRANWQFHRLINEAADSRQLLVLIRQAVRLIPSNFLAVVPVRDRSDHEELLKELERGRAQQARRVAEKHVLSAGESLAVWLATQPSSAVRGSA